MKSPADFYIQILDTLSKSGSCLMPEFEALVKTAAPRDVFLWLQYKFEQGELPADVEPILTDFFFSIH